MSKEDSQLAQGRDFGIEWHLKTCKVAVPCAKSGAEFDISTAREKQRSLVFYFLQKALESAKNRAIEPITTLKIVGIGQPRLARKLK